MVHMDILATLTGYLREEGYNELSLIYHDTPAIYRNNKILMILDFPEDDTDILPYIGNPIYHGGTEYRNRVLYRGNRGISRAGFTYLRDKLHGRMNIGPIPISYFGMDSVIDATLIYNRGEFIYSNSTDATVRMNNMYTGATGDGMRRISRKSARRGEYDTIISNGTRYDLISINTPRYIYNMSARPGTRDINIAAAICGYIYYINMRTMRLTQYTPLEFDNYSITITDLAGEEILDIEIRDGVLTINNGAEYFVDNVLNYIGSDVILFDSEYHIYRPCGLPLI